MKIRGKLILAEVILSAVVLLAVLFAIATFINYLRLEDLLIDTALLRDKVSRIKYAVIGMADSTESTSFLMTNYEYEVGLVREGLAAIETNRQFGRLPAEIGLTVAEATEAWSAIQLERPPDQISRILDLRDLSPLETAVGLTTLAAAMSEQQLGPSEYIDELEGGKFFLTGLEAGIAGVEDGLERTIAEMAEFTAAYRRPRLMLGIGVPTGVLLLGFLGAFLFAGSLSRRLRILDGALISAAKGDFTVSVDMAGGDEFGSLASSINAFTRTLGAKLEAFRLIMHDIGQTLETTIELHHVEETLVKLAMRESAADGAALYRVGAESGELVLSVFEGRYRPPFPVTGLPDSPTDAEIEALVSSLNIPPGETIIGESAVRGEAKLIRDAAAYGEADWVRQPGDRLFLASAVVLPLKTGTTVLGMLVVTSSARGRFFSDLEYANLQSFAELAAITLDNIHKYADLLEATQLNRELGIAEEIQQELLPGRLPPVANAETAFLSRSIKGLNSDYFDAFPLGEGRTMFTICEVAGRGVPAGLVMVMVRTILRLAASADRDAKTILTQLNIDMTGRIAIENYASLGVLIVSSAGDFSFSSSASYPLRIYRSAGREFQVIKTAGIPVGIDRNAVYEQAAGTLARGDLVLLHTDGVPDSRNRDGREFGIDKLLTVISEQATEDPQEIVASLRAELDHFERGTDQLDDQTVIVLKYKGGSAA